MGDHVEQLVFLLREFADGAKHGAMYSEQVKFRVYTRRLLTALDCISDASSDAKLLHALLNAAESVACIHIGTAASPAANNRHPRESEQLSEDEHKAAQLREVGRYLVMDSINRLFQRGADMGSDRKSLFSTVLRAASLLRSLACEPLTQGSWETDISILWEYLVPILPTCWQGTSHAQMVQLLLDNLTDGLQFLPASEELLCNLVERLAALCGESGEAAEREVCSMITLWISTISDSLFHQGVPNSFVRHLEAWLSRLAVQSADPQCRQVLDAAVVGFSETIVRALMDTGHHSPALQRLGREQDSSFTESVSPFHVRSAVRCMLALKRQPWEWITSVVEAGHSVQWADILHECITDCQLMGELEQADALKAHLEQLDAHLHTTELLHVGHEVADQLLRGFPLKSHVTELVERWILARVACHCQERKQDVQDQPLLKLVPIMIQHAESLRQAHLWSRAAHMFESLHCVCDLQRDRSTRSSLVIARASQCLLCWMATDEDLTKAERESVIGKAIAACSKLQYGCDVVSSCYWMLTCIVCRDESTTKSALDAMVHAEGMTREHVCCLERVALKQGMVSIAFDLRCLPLNADFHSPSIESALDTVSLGIKAITHSGTSSVRGTRFTACRDRCYQLMESLVRNVAAHWPAQATHFDDVYSLPSPGTTEPVNSAHPMLPTLYSATCAHLQNMRHEGAGVEAISRVFKVAAMVKDTAQTEAGGVSAQRLDAVTGDLYRQAAAAMQSLVQFVIADQAGSADHQGLPVLTSFVLGRVLELDHWMMQGPDSILLLSQIVDCMQDQLCEVLDCMELCGTALDCRSEPGTSASLFWETERKLQQLAVLAALMISWLACNARSTDLACTACSCIHAFKEVLPLKRLTKQGRAQVAMLLGDAVVACFHHMNDDWLREEEAHDTLFSVVACAAAFPGVRQQIGHDACAQLQQVMGARWVDPQELRSLHPENGPSTPADAEASSSQTQERAHSSKQGQICTSGSSDVPTHALVFL